MNPTGATVAKTNTYQHFCPVARSLELIGEKWSLLIVRDLLRGPRRFTDLAGGLKNITPKWLTMRLRDLEAAGIVSRESEPGRREVWYSLTPAGEDLRPVVAALNVWGIRHELRQPLVGEAVSARAMVASTVGFLASTRVRFDTPRTWLLGFSQAEQFALVFDGHSWKTVTGQAGPPHVSVTAGASDWASFLAAADGRREAALARLDLAGERPFVVELLESFHAIEPIR